jgi:hypothetical protein
LEGDYPRQLNALRRAVAIDPLWWPASWGAAEIAWNMGYRDEALKYARRVEVDGVPLPFMAHMVRGDMAWRRGDFSGVFRESQAGYATRDVGKQFFGQLGMGWALRAMGYLPEARRIWNVYNVDEDMWRMWHGEAPSAVPARLSNTGINHHWYETPFVSFLFRTLVNAGRSAEAVKLYDRQFRTPDGMADSYPGGHALFLADAASVALALREVGRRAESEHLLALADADIRASFRRGRVPRWYYALCAQIWAAQGKRAASLFALERAVGEGWYYASPESLPDIGDEPAFRRLRSDPRFERIRAKFKAHIARERRELGPVEA